MKYESEFDQTLQMLETGITITAVLIVIAIIVVGVKAISFIGYSLFHADGGTTRREQLHRHRIENFGLVLALAAFGLGGAMAFVGDTGAVANVVLPGGVRLEQASIPVILFGVASSALALVLRSRTRADKGASRLETPPSVSTAVSIGTPQAMPQASQSDAQGVADPDWLNRITYSHAWIAALLSLPFLGGLFWILVPGVAFVFWKAHKNKAETTRRAGGEAA